MTNETLLAAVSTHYDSRDIYESMTACAFGTVMNKGSLAIRSALSQAPASLFTEVCRVARENRFGNTGNIIRFISGKSTTEIAEQE